MTKTYFHNSKISNENKDKIKTAQVPKIYTKKIVDINILLNRVKLAEKIETKQKITFVSLVTLGLTLFGAFIVILK
tara:strand:- start:1990 stop:2217 length:228 start_codon:yes stop_codon:yes gene_type:complete